MDIYLASGNEHKLEEFISIAGQLGLEINLHSADRIGGMPDVEETGSTFAENALIKAEALEDLLPCGAWALADDSGLMVDALSGQPGVYSARYAGPEGNAIANNLKLLEELQGVPPEERTARFTCVLCLRQKGNSARYFSGICEGHILPAPVGKMGFGYDPLFRPLGCGQSFAELEGSVKNSFSHRGRAIAEWAKFLKSGQ